MNSDQERVAMVRSYLDGAGWLTPTVADCSRFVMQEAAEADSALMKAGFSSRLYTRNNPEEGRAAHKAAAREIGQAYFMLLSLANLLMLDLTALLDEEVHALNCKFAHKIDVEDLAQAEDAWRRWEEGDSAYLRALIYGDNEDDESRSQT